MYFKQIVTPGLGCFSYVIGCPAAKQMVVVDPKRDVQDYLDISREEGMRITHVIDTHVHADHVSGNQELRALTGCELMMFETSPVNFPFNKVTEGDEMSVGSAHLRFLHTPGHTPDALSILLADTTRSREPWMVLTGDLLFVGDIGRPDLVGEAKLDEQVANLWDSLRVKLGEYPDYVEVFPAHGSGSLCGRGMSSKQSSTLGYERRHNPMLQFDSYPAFRTEMTKEFPARPKSFTHIISTNAEGAPLLESCPMDKAMEPDQFEAAVDDDTVIIDVRDSAAFSGFHIPGSVNIGFEPQLANWVGMVVSPEKDLLLVVNSKDEYDRMVTELHRIGYDRIFGWLHGGLNAWVYSGRPVERLSQLSVDDLKDLLGKGVKIVDVRTDAELEAGKIPGAVHIPLVEMLDGNLEVANDSPVVVYCGSGYRSNIAASYMQNNGFKDVRGLAGGMIAWNRAGYPTN